ncbi:L,D-transpeptidase family protein [Mesorhizobium sp. NBSH29]|uniref:L,D-transpeptidase n=1 Tax=Mesorhizobium sp. NBSH29 TaxID=2654249 RepID=UPI001896606D|nr:L,D-transpeptidase [Mesorhizobium sp. NBSH29]QPC88754.1 L,D-transpeptidase family protein [Mesorhizobium sp. NBSH29]
MKNSAFKIAAVIAFLFGGLGQSMAAEIVARIDVSRQVMTVSQQGRVLHTWPVSTGRKGFSTPRGTYRPTRMHKMWHSRKYDMSPMPYSVFFRGGYAIHGTGYVKQLGRPASHGCVRLATGNAQRFYSLVKQAGSKNTRIVLVN